jgi:hypothetical protein
MSTLERRYIVPKNTIGPSGSHQHKRVDENRADGIPFFVVGHFSTFSLCCRSFFDICILLSVIFRHLHFVVGHFSTFSLCCRSFFDICILLSVIFRHLHFVVGHFSTFSFEDKATTPKKCPFKLILSMYSVQFTIYLIT